MDNQQAARTLFGVASLLEAQRANPYRVRAYRRAAINVMRLPTAAEALVARETARLGVDWLGDRLRHKVSELVLRGRMQFHDDLLTSLPRPYRELLGVPGVGPRTAERLLRDLRIGSVTELARAAREGKLRRLRGIGPIREQQLAEAAESMLLPRAA